MIQASFINGDDLEKHNYVGNHSGFVITALEAYKYQLNLVLDPADIMVATLVQIGLGNYKRYPSIQETAAQSYKIPVEGSIHPDDNEHFAETFISKFKGTQSQDQERQTSELIKFALKQNIMKPCEAEVPLYHAPTTGGIPSVTLLGEKADWEGLLPLLEEHDIPTRTDMRVFRNALRPVFRYFLKSFDDPEDSDVVSFWECMWYHQDGGLTPQEGWLTAFSRWNQDGILNVLNNEKAAKAHGLYSGNFDKIGAGYRVLTIHGEDPRNPNEVAKFVAGTVGTEFCSSQPEGHGRLDTVRPVSAYFMFKT